MNAANEMFRAGRDLMTKRERTLREQLGIWRYLSPEWRKYRRESGR